MLAQVIGLVPVGTLPKLEPRMNAQSLALTSYLDNTWAQYPFGTQLQMVLIRPHC